MEQMEQLENANNNNELEHVAQTAAEHIKEDTGKQASKIQCPCCGQQTLETPVKLSDELVDYWLAGVLSGTPFIKTYPLYGGKMHITIKKIDIEDGALVDDMAFVLDAIRRRGDSAASGVDMEHMRSLAFVYAPVVAISSDSGLVSEPVTYKPASVVLEAATEIAAYRNACTAETVPDACIEAISKHYSRFIDPKLMSGLPTYVCMAAAEAHARLAAILTDAGIDANFWKGIELA